MLQHHVLRRSRASVASLLAALLAFAGLVAVAAPARAAGTPDVAFTLTSPAEALLGSTVPVTLRAQNGTATDGYNTSFRLVLPAGVSLASASPAVSETIAGPSGTTVLIWSNTADLLAGTSTSVTAQVAFSAAAGPGAVTFSGGAYVNSDPRYQPDFDATGAPVAGPTSYTGSATGTSTTQLVPFRTTKTVHRPENEVPRGVHDQKTVVSLRVDNNLVGPSTALSLVDHLPGRLEFLGCGATDNSAAGTEEYPGAGRIDATPAPALANPCATPSAVETLQVDPPGPQPLGLYTRVTWSSASLAAAVGSANLAAGGSFSIDYVMGVPQRANVAFGAGAPTPASGQQGSNLDNNTGASTLETTEQSATNTATASGTYAGAGYTSTDQQTVSLEDVAIQKSVFPGTIVQGQLSTWTLDLQVSEYTATATGIRVTDTVPDGLCPLGAGSGDAECAGGPAPSVAYTSATENADGTWTLVWDLPDAAADATRTITYSTRTRAAYQQNGADAEPVRANDSWTNTVGVSASVTEVSGGPTRTVQDTSSAGQTAGPISLAKQVAAPVGGACGDGSGLTWQTGTSATAFGPGDLVCWRITISTPTDLDTTGLQLTDFLPAGYTFSASATGASSDVAFPAATVSGRRISWTLPSSGDLDESRQAQVVVSSLITDPNASAPEDVSGNLAKLSYRNTAGQLFQLRDAAQAPWEEPRLVLDKIVAPTTADSGDTVTYTVAVQNTGDVDALDVQVRDLVPSRIGCAGVTGLPAGFTCSAGQINGTIATIAVGATATISYTATLPGDVAPGETFDNHAGVRQYQVATNTTPTRFTYVPSSNIDPTQNASANTVPADDTARVTAPAATIVKNHTTSVVEGVNTAATATVGERVDYTVAVTLPDDTTMSGATISDPLPATLDLLESGPAPAVVVDGVADPSVTVATSGNTVTVTFPSPYTVPVGADRVVTLTYSAVVRDVAGAVNGTNINNTATLRYAPPGGTAVTRTDGETTRVVEPDVGVAKTEDDADNQADPGELVTYHVTVDDAAGAAVAHDTVVVDTLPTSVDPVDGGGDPVADGGTVGPDLGTWDATARTITWSVPTLAAGASTVLDYTVRVANPIPSPTTFTNTARATTTSLAGAVAGERTAASAISPTRYAATASVTLDGPRPSLTKTVDRGTAAVGEAVTFTVVATIPPQVQTFDATVLDTLPAGLTYLDTVSASCTAPAGCGLPVATLTPSGQRVGWFLGDLAASAQTRQFTIVYRAVVADVAQATRGAVLTNQAVVANNSTDQVAGTPATPPATSSFEGVSAAASRSVTVVEPTVTLDKEVAGEGTPDDTRRVKPGQALDFSVTVRNTGNSTAHDLVVADTVDPRMVAVDVSDGTGWTVTDADPSDGSLAFRVSSLAAGGSVVITYRLRVPALTAADEVPGYELANTADATYTSAAAGSPGPVRTYDDVASDTVQLEADVASLGDTVWLDQDGDGVQGAGEPGLAGVDVTVTYLGADGLPGGGDDETVTVTTDAAGHWLADELPAGSYRVSVDLSDLPAGTAPGYDLDGGTDGTADLVLAENGVRTDVDFAAVGTGAVGDTVWLDVDADGTQDAGEPGVGGVDVVVTWAGPDGTLGTADDVAYPTTTAADGTWRVDGVPAGPVRVALDPISFPAGTAPSTDPDGGPADGTADGTLAAGGTDLTFDFALAGTGSLGDRVWLDRDQDGVQDAGEPGIAGATVRWTWAGPDGVIGTPDDLQRTVTTGADGAWLVEHLPAGPYLVEVTSLPTALAPTSDEDDGTSSPDGRTTLTLTAGGDHLTADFGFAAATGVGDTVWLDQDADGVRDAGEPGLPGVEVTVTSAGQDGALGTSDDIVITTTTDADGSWLVTGLPAGPTRVAVTAGLPAGVSPTFDADGTGTPGVSELVLADGITDLDQDFGYAGLNSIGDTVWADADHDGVQDAGEPGLPGVQVRVTFLGADGAAGGGDDVVLLTTTGTDGTYHVPGLPDGDYTVEVVSGVPAGYAPTADETGAADGRSRVDDLGTSGPRDHGTADFGYGGAGALGGRVWFDANADGTVDGGAEPGLGGIGVDVVWAGPDGVLGTGDDVTFRATTGSDGRWLVEDLPPGTYRATVDASTLPAGVSVVFDRDDGLTGPDGVWDGSLAPSERRTDVDTGVRGTGSIGDLVWVDTDRDGTRDAGERGARGVDVTVTWLGPDGKVGGGDDVVFTTTTGAGGAYSVVGLPAGAYVVTVDRGSLPDGTSPGSDLDGGSRTTTRVTLAQAEHRTDVDFALWTPLAPASPPSGGGTPGGTGDSGDDGPGGSLAWTGAEVGLTALLAMLLLGAGVALRRAGRRRGEQA